MIINTPSEAERTMWWRLRMKRAGAKFRREHPIGPYRADFACLEFGLEIELDGGQHMTREAQAHDTRRDAFMKATGWIVLRIWTIWWFQNPHGILHAIDEALAAARIERAQRFQGACSRTPLNRLRLTGTATTASRSLPTSGEAVGSLP